MTRSNNNVLTTAAKTLAVAILVDHLGTTAGAPSLLEFVRAEFVELAEASGLTPEQCGTILRDECHKLSHA